MADWKYCDLYYEYIEGDHVRIFLEELSKTNTMPIRMFYDSDQYVEYKEGMKDKLGGEFIDELWFEKRDEEARLKLYSAVAELGREGWELFSIREKPHDVQYPSIIKSQFWFKQEV